MPLRAWRLMFCSLAACFCVLAGAVSCGDDDDDDDAEADDDDGAPSECVDGCEDGGDGTFACGCVLWKTTDTGYALDYYDAQAYVESLEYANRTGWRLPTVDELVALHDPNRPLAVPANGGNTVYIREPFEMVGTDLWSGDAVPEQADRAYLVSFMFENEAVPTATNMTYVGAASVLAVLDLE